MSITSKIIVRLYELLILLFLVTLTFPAHWAVNYNVLIDGVKRKGIMTTFIIALVLFTPLLLLSHAILAFSVVLVNAIMYGMKLKIKQQEANYQNQHNI